MALNAQISQRFLFFMTSFLLIRNAASQWILIEPVHFAWQDQIYANWKPKKTVILVRPIFWLFVSSIDGVVPLPFICLALQTSPVKET